jgi:hypothetical protein
VVRYYDLSLCDDHVAASRNHELAYRMNELLDVLCERACRMNDLLDVQCALCEQLGVLCEQQDALCELAYRMTE